MLFGIKNRCSKAGAESKSWEFFQSHFNDLNARHYKVTLYKEKGLLLKGLRSFYIINFNNRVVYLHIDLIPIPTTCEFKSIILFYNRQYSKNMIRTKVEPSTVSSLEKHWNQLVSVWPNTLIGIISFHDPTRRVYQCITPEVLSGM